MKEITDKINKTELSEEFVEKEFDPYRAWRDYDIPFDYTPIGELKKKYERFVK